MVGDPLRQTIPMLLSLTAGHHEHAYCRLSYARFFGRDDQQRCNTKKHYILSLNFDTGYQSGGPLTGASFIQRSTSSQPIQRTSRCSESGA